MSRERAHEHAGAQKLVDDKSADATSGARHENRVHSALGGRGRRLFVRAVDLCPANQGPLWMPWDVSLIDGSIRRPLNKRTAACWVPGAVRCRGANSGIRVLSVVSAASSPAVSVEKFIRRQICRQCAHRREAATQGERPVLPRPDARHHTSLLLTRTFTAPTSRLPALPKAAPATMSAGCP